VVVLNTFEKVGNQSAFSFEDLDQGMVKFDKND